VSDFRINPPSFFSARRRVSGGARRRARRGRRVLPRPRRLQPRRERRPAFRLAQLGEASLGSRPRSSSPRSGRRTPPSGRSRREGRRRRGPVGKIFRSSRASLQAAGGHPRDRAVLSMVFNLIKDVIKKATNPAQPKPMDIGKDSPTDVQLPRLGSDRGRTGGAPSPPFPSPPLPLRQLLSPFSRSDGTGTARHTTPSLRAGRASRSSPAVVAAEAPPVAHGSNGGRFDFDGAAGGRLRTVRRHGGGAGSAAAVLKVSRCCAVDVADVELGDPFFTQRLESSGWVMPSAFASFQILARGARSPHTPSEIEGKD